MKNYAIKTILVISVLTCGSLGLVLAQEAVPAGAQTAKTTAAQAQKIDTSSPAAQTYLAHETAILNKDYTKAWNLECSSLRANRWKNSFEALEKFYSERKSAPEEKERFLSISAIKNISANEVHLSVGSGQTFVVVNENGKWCFAGLLDDIRSWKK